MTQRNVVMVIDDNPDVLNLVHAILLRHGFRVQVACDGAEGLDCFHRHHLELCLVITDIVMPKMNGLALARAIRAIDADLPVLLISGHMQSDSKPRCAGEFPLLLKPFSPTQLMISIAALVQRPADTPATNLVSPSY